MIFYDSLPILGAQLPQGPCKGVTKERQRGDKGRTKA